MYPLILNRIFNEPWCVTLEQHYAFQEGIISYMEKPNAGGLSGASMQVPFTPKAAGLGLSAPTERGSRLYSKGALGVIPVYGAIGNHLSGLEMMCGGYSIEQFNHDMELAAERSDLKRVLVDFHSPGGTVTGIPEGGKAFAQLGKVKETFGFTSGHSASASYWLMSQANNIYITESASVGSIGVYLALLDRSDAMKQRGEKLKLFKAGKHKAMGLPGNPLTEDDEALLQANVDKIYNKFTQTVLSKRPNVKSSTMQGQMFTGDDAVKVKLVDSVVGSLGYLVRKLS